MRFLDYARNDKGGIVMTRGAYCDDKGEGTSTKSDITTRSVVKAAEPQERPTPKPQAISLTGRVRSCSGSCVTIVKGIEADEVFPK